MRKEALGYSRQGWPRSVYEEMLSLRLSGWVPLKRKRQVRSLRLGQFGLKMVLRSVSDSGLRPAHTADDLAVLADQNLLKFH